MAYDPSKDVKVADLGQFGESETEYLDVGIYKYNGGKPKVRVHRVTIGKTGKEYRASVLNASREEFAVLFGMGPTILEHLK